MPPTSILRPVLERFLPNYPDIKVEIVIDYGLTDIVAERFDAGVRFGETVASGMISVRIAPDMRMAVVGAPAYFARRMPPTMPQDLTDHECINLRLPTHGGLYAWEFDKAGREIEGPRRRATGLRYRGTCSHCRARGVRPGLSDRGAGARYLEKWPSGSGSRRAGASPFQATIFTIQAVANLRRPSLCWSKRFVTAKLTEPAIFSPGAGHHCPTRQFRITSAFRQCATRPSVDNRRACCRQHA